MLTLFKKILKHTLPELGVKELTASDADRIINSGEVIEDTVQERKCPYGEYDSCHYRKRTVTCDGKRYLLVHVTPSEYIPMYSYGGGIQSGSTRQPTGDCKDPTQFLYAEVLSDE